MPAAKPIVVVTRKLPDLVETRLMELFESRLNAADRPLSSDEIVAACAEADVLVQTVTDKISGDVIGA